MTFNDFLVSEAISVSRAARELELSRQYTSRLRQGRTVPRPDKIERIRVWSNGRVDVLDWYKKRVA